MQGPRSAKPIALRLIEWKREVMAQLKPTYMFPWPEILPDFTHRRVAAYAPCTGGPGNVHCPHGAGSWVRYNDAPTCLPCARYAIESAVVVTTRPPTPKKVPGRRSSEAE